MEMCYDGALVMPSSFAVVDADEMMYLGGGGTLKVIASKSTVRTICRSGVAIIGMAIGTAFSGPVLARVISGALSVLIYDFIIDICGVSYKAINKKWKKSWLPNATLNLNKYV